MNKQDIEEMENMLDFWIQECWNQLRGWVYGWTIVLIVLNVLYEFDLFHF